MQPLSAYALAAEQLKLCLNNDASPKYAAIDELALMNQVIGELEVNLWLLQEFWRLSALPQAPTLLATSLDAVFRAVLQRLEKRHPTLSVVVEGGRNDQYVQSSVIWLGTLLSCLFESLIQNTQLGLSVGIQAGEREVEIRISESSDEGRDTLVCGLQGGAEDVPAKPGRPGFARQLATEIAAALKCRLSVNASDISLILRASCESDRQAVAQPDRHAALSGRQIAVFETDPTFSEDLAGLFRAWGCEVLCFASPEQIGAFVSGGKFADALFVGFDLWKHQGQAKADFAGYLKNAANVFVTVSRECAAEVPADHHECVFLPRPFSPVRLRKHMMSLFSLAG